MCCCRNIQKPQKYTVDISRKTTTKVGQQNSSSLLQPIALLREVEEKVKVVSEAAARS